MKCIILAAGYATRLYPLTQNFPKPLLEVGGKAILDWLIDDLRSSAGADSFAVVTNHKFAPHFSAWAMERSGITVLDDGTLTNETRLGAVRDIRYATDTLHIDDDVLVMAGDNLLDFSLGAFVSYSREKGTSCIMRYHESDPARLRKCGVVETGEDDIVLSMEEKPQQPKSSWCCPPFYWYVREDISRIAEGLDSGCAFDAPGSFAAWLSSRTAVHAMRMPGSRYDIGSLETYSKVCAEYKGINR